MSSLVPTAQLKYLKYSAHYLAAQSPSTSSHLLSVHNQLLRDESKRLSAAQHRELCGACGSIRSSDSSKAIVVKHNGVLKRRKKRVSPAETSPLVLYRCLRCQRQKFLTSQSNTKPSTSRKPHLTAIASTTQTSSQTAKVDPQTRGTESTATATLQKSTENLSSKKRAKARKQQGLMAALAAGKQRAHSQTSPSGSLDLLDFLKH
ncbi:uncharacterized protein BDCG_06951 [Blastomyces dermatitidis ER-3]|uniref:Cullin binding protein CanA n=1 Tax=Ajellomyces dermatitidis (strain ER-3 / ATCC MYA-2586) TaxID=559297 RepID=A0ABP2F4D6_AJEDR|nr:uncharacterized protein BDCG_06951 [Blastomyces dermatitidis ER-3]EEQ91831.1 hypothetical protein BDCG_06951 [Blastomyces dermatitidis ER-3]